MASVPFESIPLDAVSTITSSKRTNSKSSKVVVEPTETPISAMDMSSMDSKILDEIKDSEHTGWGFSTKKKWWILTVVALCQTSMNFVSNLAAPNASQHWD